MRRSRFLHYLFKGISAFGFLHNDFFTLCSKKPLLSSSLILKSKLKLKPKPMAKVLFAAVGEQYCDAEERELTVRKTSFFYPGDGYAAYDHHNGELVFRVDTYGRGSSFTDHLLLMDVAGVPILTVRRKRPSLHQRWEGYLGDGEEGQEHLFSVKRSTIFGSGIDVELHGGGGDNNGRQFRIEGCFAERCCRVLMFDKDEENDEVVAEIKRKVDAGPQMVLAKDVFSLCIKPRFDAAFAMGLVLVLDQIGGDDDDDDGDNESVDDDGLK